MTPRKNEKGHSRKRSCRHTVDPASLTSCEIVLHESRRSAFVTVPPLFGDGPRPPSRGRKDDLRRTPLSPPVNGGRCLAPGTDGVPLPYFTCSEEYVVVVVLDQIFLVILSQPGIPGNAFLSNRRKKGCVKNGKTAFLRALPPGLSLRVPLIRSIMGMQNPSGVLDPIGV
jgi:hypothetical protein